MRRIHIAACLVATTLCLAPLAKAASDDSGTGHVEFRNSCGDSVAAEFNRGVALLHSFEYPESEKAFRAILERSNLEIAGSAELRIRGGARR